MKRLRDTHVDRRRRCGAVLVAALVCLLIVMAVLSGMLQGALRARRQLHLERDLRQTELMLQAGAHRAAFRFTGEPDYRGETWNLPAEMITGSKTGQVTIAISRDADDQPWHANITAEYPAGSQTSIRRSHAFEIQPQSAQTEE
jgi:hypothetical protein